ncbi:hypothetical protein GTK09_14410 [Jiella sp. 40Bstr34]|uniref:Uncharacterized protein n=2 Tax=Jiella pacifica TaxID=2696469 RepID=A0A6N9T6C6_9HYPH|nr:hypothetical protein [Jiella pacifica]
MIVKIATSGGFAGIPAAGINKTVDVSSLPPPLQERVCRAFEPPKLKRLEKSGAPDTSVDRFNYAITVTDDAGEVHRYRLEESVLPAELIDLMDEM